MQEGTRLAAVDLGSNSFRLEIGRYEHGQIHRTEYFKETVRQGNGLDEAATSRRRRCSVAGTAWRVLASGWLASARPRCAPWRRRRCAKRATGTSS